METRDQRQEVHLHEKPAKEHAFDKFAYELASGSVSGKRALRLLGALLRDVITSNQEKEPATATSFLPLFPPHPEDFEEFLEGPTAPDEVDYEALYESQCGAADDSQAVEQYDGTLEVTTDFVSVQQRPVGNIHWNDNLSTIFTNPGSVSGVRWCSGTLISEDLFLTAGHCFDSNPSGWTVPKANGTPNPIPPAEIATNMHIDFDYQVDPSGNLRTEQSFAITQLEEHRLGGLDYAIVRLNGRPGDTFGFTSISSVDAAIGDMLCIIGHPAGVPKRIEAGPATDFHDTRIGYNDIDTLGGNSGSGILRSPQQTIVGVHTNGGCTASGSGHNHGQRISSLTNVSPILSGLTTFRNLGKVLDGYGYEAGTWRVERHPRFLADLTGDGRADFVGFGNTGVYVALSNGDGTFSPSRRVIDGFGYEAGTWRVERHPRFLADLTGDGRADIVGFGNAGVHVALSNGDGTFSPSRRVIDGFGYEAGTWRVERHPRFLADLTGDGRADIVGFGNAGVHVALSNGDGTFSPSRRVIDGFGYEAGTWRVERHPPFLADLTGDGRADIVGFGNAGVHVALSNGDGTFSP